MALKSTYKLLHARFVQLQQEMAKVKSSLSTHREHVQEVMTKALAKVDGHYFVVAAKRNRLYQVVSSSFAFKRSTGVDFTITLKRKVYDLETGTETEDEVRRISLNLPDNAFNWIVNGDLLTCDTSFMDTIVEAKKRNILTKIQEAQALQATLEKELKSLGPVIKPPTLTYRARTTTKRASN